MPCMCWWREKAKKALLEDFSPAPCFTCSMLRDTTLCDRIEAQLLRSRTYAHALFSSINTATHRQLPLNMLQFGCFSKKSQNMQKCSPQTLEQGIIYGYLHETWLQRAVLKAGLWVKTMCPSSELDSKFQVFTQHPLTDERQNVTVRRRS
jgi:hypothetical protein